MIFHVCSHWGDIEIEDHGDNQALVRWFKLTPLERESLDKYLTSLDMELSGPEGELVIPKPVVEVGAAIGGHLHDGDALITAIKFSTGDIKASTNPILGWWRNLWGAKPTPEPAQPSTKELPHPIPLPEPVAVVQTPVPRRGCPMPTMTELREAKAAGVVRKFLVGQQIEDFNRRRAFLTVGCDTGHLYRVTSRWAPEVERYGVLHNLTTGRRICASNKKLPPSEEVLSMKFVVEIAEQAFLDLPG